MEQASPAGSIPTTADGSDKPDTNDGRVKTNEGEIAKLLGLKMVNDPVNKLQIKLLEGPDRFINFAFSKKFNEHLSLPRPGRRSGNSLSTSGL